MAYNIAANQLLGRPVSAFLDSQDTAQRNALNAQQFAAQQQNALFNQQRQSQQDAYTAQDRAKAQNEDELKQVHAHLSYLAAATTPEQFSALADRAAADPVMQSVMQRHGITRDEFKTPQEAAQGAQMVAAALGVAAPVPGPKSIVQLDPEKNAFIQQPDGSLTPFATAKPSSAKAQLVEVPLPNGTVQKQWVVPGEKSGVSVGTAVKPKGDQLAGFSDPKIQDLQAAIASTGYALPTGFRSQAQQISLYQGLLRKYDGLDPNDIAHLLANNAIDYKGVSKATQTAAGIAGKVEFANKELEAFAPIALDANASVPRGSFVPFSKLRQMGERNISDPDLKRLFIATQTMLNSYDMLASRGGTDQAKRAENHKILETADSPETYAAAVQMIMREGKAAGSAAAGAMKSDAYKPPVPGGSAPPPPTATGPGGQKLILQNGQWVPANGR